jgi:integrase
MKITKKAVDAAKHPAQGQVFLRDDSLHGFALRVTPGSKTFVLEKEIHRRIRRMTLGRYGVLTVEQARNQAQAMMADIVRGHDPIAERQARRTAPTFGDLVDLYVARHLPTKKSRINDEGLLTHHLAHWRGRMLASITRADIIALHTQIGTQPSTVIRPGRPTARPAPRLANSVLTLLSSLFNLATDWGLYTGANPTARIKKFPARSRDRFVTPDELPRLWAALAADPSPFIRVAFLVSLLTGARRNEVLTMQWTDVDFTQGTWRIPETKAGRVHLLPLPRPVLVQLSALPRFAENPYVFVGRWGRSHLVNVSKPWTRIKTAAGLSDVRVHDLRRTLGSWLVAAGASLPLIGKTLNHSSVSTTQIYARLQLDPVRAALENNAAKMLDVIDQAEELGAKSTTPRRTA